MKYNTHINIVRTVSGQLEGNRPIEMPVCLEVANIKVNLKE
jgi:hypothetical protein